MNTYTGALFWVWLTLWALTSMLKVSETNTIPRQCVSRFARAPSFCLSSVANTLQGTSLLSLWSLIACASVWCRVASECRCIHEMYYCSLCRVLGRKSLPIILQPHTSTEEVFLMGNYGICLRKCVFCVTYSLFLSAHAYSLGFICQSLSKLWYPSPPQHNWCGANLICQVQPCVMEAGCRLHIILF